MVPKKRVQFTWFFLGELPGVEGQTQRAQLGVEKKKSISMTFWLVVEPTHLKHISQNGNLSQVGMNIKKSLKPPPSFFF